MPIKQHTPKHTYNVTGSPYAGLRVYCTTCNIAYVDYVSESFHPDGASPSVVATRIIPEYHNTSEGTSAEKCTDTNCSGKGKHYECACGAILYTMGQYHTRNRVNGPSLKWVHTSSGSTYTTHAKVGTIIKISNTTTANEAPVTIHEEGTQDVTINLSNYANGYQYLVSLDGVITITAGKWAYHTGSQFGTSATVISPSMDVGVYAPSDGSWILPSASNYLGQAIDIDYSDGIKVAGGYPYYDTEDTLYLNKAEGGYNAGVNKIKITLTGGQRVAMTYTASSRKYGVFATIILTDLDGNVVDKSEVNRYIKETTSSFVKVYAPYSGTYYVCPCLYSCEDSVAYWPYSQGSVTVFADGAVKPAQEEQNISVSLNSTSVGFGDTSPTLSTVGAQTGLSYKSSNTDVASIDTNGKISIKGLGTTTITVTAAETSDYFSATSTVTLTVGKGNLTLKVNPSSSTINYGQALSSSTLSSGTVANGSGTAVGGTWAWKSPTSIPSSDNHIFIARFTPTDKEHYNY